MVIHHRTLFFGHSLLGKLKARPVYDSFLLDHFFLLECLHQASVSNLPRAEHADVAVDAALTGRLRRLSRVRTIEPSYDELFSCCGAVVLVVGWPSRTGRYIRRLG